MQAGIINSAVFRTATNFVLACLLPVILAGGSCLACFSIVLKPASRCCSHSNQCQNKTSDSDCLDQAADRAQTTADTSNVTRAAQATPAPMSTSPVSFPPPVFAVVNPPSGQASPPGLFVLHSSFLI